MWTSETNGDFVEPQENIGSRSLSSRSRSVRGHLRESHTVSSPSMAKNEISHVRDLAKSVELIVNVLIDFQTLDGGKYYMNCGPDVPRGLHTSKTHHGCAMFLD